jgi:hypothetical protein
MRFKCVIPFAYQSLWFIPTGFTKKIGIVVNDLASGASGAKQLISSIEEQVEDFSEALLS